MTIEHIAARRGEENVEKCLLDISAPNALTVFEQKIDAGTKAPSDAEKVNVLHHLANLVIDPQGPNAAKNNLAVTRKLSWFQTAPYLSQIELEDYLLSNNNVWDASVVQSRGKVLADFATRRWNEDDIGEIS